MERELILNKLEAKEGPHELVLVLDHLKAGFNIGKIIRTAEVFGLKEVHIIGTRFFDPYPAKGAIKRVKLLFYPSIKESLKRLIQDDYEVFLMDMNSSHYLHEIALPNRCAFIFGNEEVGPSLEGVDTMSMHDVKIQQFGQTESLNVSIAASITAYAYVFGQK